jgi:hypothetical protein
LICVKMNSFDFQKHPRGQACYFCGVGVRGWDHVFQVLCVGVDSI